MSGQQFGITNHAEPVVCQTVQEDNSVAISVVRTKNPGTQNRAIRRCHGDVIKAAAACFYRILHSGDVSIPQRSTYRVQRPIGNKNSAHDAQPEVQE